MYPIRTGLTSVGMVGGPVGMQPQDPTLAEVLKTQGYATGQFGKNHLGDRNEHLPTLHGFDEFFGNLYHLNTEEEPEDEDYPTDPEFKKRHGPRGVLHTWATDTLRQGRQPADRRYGASDPQADGNGGRGTRQGGHRLHEQGPRGRETVFHLVRHHADAHLHAGARAVP
jgi:arylsulfatase A-like enzyme